MKKYASLIASALGAGLLVLQQAIADKNMDLKVVGLSVLIAILGVISVDLKGKGLSIAGIIGTVVYTFVTIWKTGSFTWNEFIMNAVAAILLVLIPSIKPVADTNPKSDK